MPIHPIQPGDAETLSADLRADNLARLRALFPELATEGPGGAALNVDVLRALIGDAAVGEGVEKYGLTWHGKRAARALALTPSSATLRPSRADSVDWDGTRNLMIEGDNLEVLKLLQRSYAGKVKLIYIDPPYNTGKDFVYPDNFQDSIRNYLELTGQLDGGRKITSNTEASGRFHTDWLNMMYPRLKLAHSLLRDDGVIFVSIDDVEVSRLRQVCDEIFGEENFVAEIVWEGANKNDAKQIGIVHEYVLVYSKNRAALPFSWSVKKEGVEPVLKEVARLLQVHDGDYEAASRDLAGWFRAMKASTSFLLRRFRYIDSRGVYKEDDPTAPGGRKFDLKHPLTGSVIPLRNNRGWGFSQDQFDLLVAEGRISFVGDSGVMVRRYLHETDSLTPPSVLYQPARSASERLRDLMGGDVFDFPKDESVISKFIEMSTEAEDSSCIVLDFFAGSGSTGHAVMNQNISDGGTRRFVLVQLPELLGAGRGERYLTIAEITRDRLDRAGRKLKTENPLFTGDTGFRSFRLATSNLTAWTPRPQGLEGSLFDQVEHVVPGRSDDDLLHEMLLKLGLDLCVPIQTRHVAGKAVRRIGAMFVCLDAHIGRDDAEPVALAIAQWLRDEPGEGEPSALFRDSAFADDVAKSNLAVILDQHGIKRVRSL